MLIQPAMLTEETRSYIPDGKSLYILEEFEGFTLYNAKSKRLNYPSMGFLSLLTDSENPTPLWTIESEALQKQGYKEVTKNEFASLFENNKFELSVDDEDSLKFAAMLLPDGNLLCFDKSKSNLFVVSGFEKCSFSQLVIGKNAISTFSSGTLDN
ncbi:MAG: hypothetical protein GF353_21600 [Candidatus Lokiarchaeota archaeon]|nr:hypothetical protein [Candidatus Lokiarchaeota archaeon]